MSRRAITPGGLYSPSVRPRDLVLGVIRDAGLNPIDHPWRLALLLVAVATLAFARLGGFTSYLLVIGVILLVCGIFWIVGRATDRAGTVLSSLVQWGALILVPSGLIAALFGVGFVDPRFSYTQWLLLLPMSMLCALLVAILSVLQSRNRELADELLGATEVLESLEGPEMLGIQDTRRQLALFLHGPVQGRLQGIIHKLRLARDTRGPRNMDDVLRDVDVVIEQAQADLRSLGPRAERPSMAATLARLQANWAGLIRVVGDISSEAEERADDSTREVISHLLTDMVTNASRHARADNAEIVVEVVGDDVIVVCVDDGLGTEVERACSGVVARVLAERGGVWTVSGMGADRGARSVARVPMVQTPMTAVRVR